MSGKETSMSLKFLKGCERLNAWDKDFLAFDSGNDSTKFAITWKACEEGIGSIRRNLSGVFPIDSPNSSSTSSLKAGSAENLTTSPVSRSRKYSVPVWSSSAIMIVSVSIDGRGISLPSKDRPNAPVQLLAEGHAFSPRGPGSSVPAEKQKA